MTLETKFLRLPHPVPLGHVMDDGWRVCWLRGWDKHHILFVVMALRKHEQQVPAESRRACRRMPLCR